MKSWDTFITAGFIFYVSNYRRISMGSYGNKRQETFCLSPVCHTYSIIDNGWIDVLLPVLVSISTRTRWNICSTNFKKKSCCWMHIEVIEVKR